MVTASQTTYPQFKLQAFGEQSRPIVSSPVSVQKIAAPSTAFAPLAPTASM
jgi:hypothetical protein